MQDTKLNAKVDLSEFYNSDNLSDLFKVFPKLKSNITQKTNTNSPYINKMYVDKFSFYQMILEKIKNYFEINESFIISKSISIILNDIKSIIESNNSRKNTNFHVLNNALSIHKRTQSKDNLKIKRALSTKSNGKNKINEQNKRKDYNIFFDFEKEKNLCDINHVYMNLKKDKQPKIKMIHFMNEDIKSKNISPKPKMKGKKSNLKKIKSKRELNTTKSIDLNESNLNSNEYSSRTRKTSFNNTKTEASIRNKSNGIKFQEREGYNPTNTNYKIIQEIPYDNKLLIDSNDNSIDNKDFDIFALSLKVGKGNVLPLIGNYIFTKYNFNEFMNISKFRNWCEKISKGVFAKAAKAALCNEDGKHAAKHRQKQRHVWRKGKRKHKTRDGGGTVLPGIGLVAELVKEEFAYHGGNRRDQHHPQRVPAVYDNADDGRGQKRQQHAAHDEGGRPFVPRVGRGGYIQCRLHGLPPALRTLFREDLGLGVLEHLGERASGRADVGAAAALDALEAVELFFKPFQVVYVDGVRHHLGKQPLRADGGAAPAVEAGGHFRLGALAFVLGQQGKSVVLLLDRHVQAA